MGDRQNRFSREHHDLALRLETLGNAMNDQCGANTRTGTWYLDAAKLLRRAGESICAKGYYGCLAGDRCTSDHKQGSGTDG